MNVCNDTNMPDISIIIPVYKVEKYIQKCLQSLLNQTHKNFEVILIDDGSPDQSIDIAKKLVGIDERFIFLNKPNGGQASARNLGLQYAKGTYFSFLDSDDYFEPTFLEAILNVFHKKPEIDVVMCGYKQVTETGEVLNTFMPRIDPNYQTDDVLFTQENIDYNVWNKVYHRSVWENQSFVEGIIYEDKEILPRLLYQKNLYLLDEYLCCYVKRDGSTMNSYNRQKSITSILYIYQSFKEFLQTHNIYEENIGYYQKSYLKFCLFRQLYMQIYFSDNYLADSNYLASQLDKNIYTLSNIRKYYGLLSKQYLSSLVFKISPQLVKTVYKFQQKFSRPS